METVHRRMDVGQKLVADASGRCSVKSTGRSGAFEWRKVETGFENTEWQQMCLLKQ
ncbi:hypothetical protein [Paenibacillus sp. Y412MC10]|uniref:hypothetical protein n=1 Tax=Geobacillus sp. (strain Y412MC10) TaxID=481743 RepID=UPI001C92F823|nr:hypothetical protein [Paenibacillus sp. Y412MC10]